MSSNALRCLLSSSLVLSLLGCCGSGDATSTARRSPQGGSPFTPGGAAARSGGQGFGGSNGGFGLSQPSLAGSSSVATSSPFANKPGQVCASAVVRTQKTP